MDEISKFTVIAITIAPNKDGRFSCKFRFDYKRSRSYWENIFHGLQKNQKKAVKLTINIDKTQK